MLLVYKEFTRRACTSHTLFRRPLQLYLTVRCMTRTLILNYSLARHNIHIDLTSISSMLLDGLDCVVCLAVGVRCVYGVQFFFSLPAPCVFFLCAFDLFYQNADTSFYSLLTLIDRQPGQMSPISRVQSTSTPNTSDMTDLPAWIAVGRSFRGCRCA